MHNRNTGATLEREATGLSGARSRAGSRSRNAGGVEARTVLATLTAVGSGVTTVAVHGAAAALGPVTADSVSELGSAAAIGSGDAGRLGGGGSGGLTKNWLARSSRGRRTADNGSGVILWGIALDRSGTLATVLTSVGSEAVAISVTTVAVRRAASAVRTVSVTCGAAKVLSAAAIVPSLGSIGSSSLGGLGSRCVSTAREAAGSAVSGCVSTPSVLGAACAGVDCAVGVAKHVAVGRAALSVWRVLGSLPLGGDDTEG